MENINQILDYIARTNLFNFLIFLGIIIFLVIKLDVKSKLESGREAVGKTIDDSEEVKTKSEEKLHDIEESMLHLKEDIDTILKESEENSKLVGKRILEDAEKTVLAIRENTERAVENSRALLKNDLIRRASLASVEVAKAHILEELSRNASLHEKLIDESIEALEGVKPE